MECSEPGAIRDEELLAYIDGAQVRPAVPAHLAHCQYCSSQLAAYQRMDRTLMQRLYRWDCPTNQALGEYQLGLLDREQAVGVQDHLKSCALCATEVATLTSFLENDPLLIPYDPLSQQIPIKSQNTRPVQGAKRVIEQWGTEGIAGVHRIIATLLVSQPRLAYQRDIVEWAGTNPVPTWPRRYSAEDLTIAIQVERTPQHAHQRGSLQLLGFVTRDGRSLEELQGTSVLLLSQTKVGKQDEQNVYFQTIDDLGNFLFSALEPDTYMLELQLPERTVAIEQLSLTL